MRAGQVAKVILVSAAVVAALYSLWLIRNVLALVVMALLLAVALGPLVDIVQRRARLPRAAAILLSYAVIVGGIVAVGIAVVPPIVTQVNDFVAEAPGFVEDLQSSKTFRVYDEKYDISQNLAREAERLPERLGSAVSALESVTVGVFSALGQFIAVLAIAFFLLLDGKRMVRWIERELGPDDGGRFRRVAEDVYNAIGGYLVGMGVLATLAGTGAYIVLSLLGVEFALPLAVLVALFNLVPLIGSAIALGVVAIAAAIDDFPTAPLVWLAFFGLYQQLENNVLQPMIYRRTVQMKPLVVIVSVLIGISVLGILGALLAIPAAAAVQIILKDWWQLRKRRLAARAGAAGPPPPFSGMPGAPEAALEAPARAAQETESRPGMVENSELGDADDGETQPAVTSHAAVPGAGAVVRDGDEAADEAERARTARPSGDRPE